MDFYTSCRKYGTLSAVCDLVNIYQGGTDACRVGDVHASGGYRYLLWRLPNGQLLVITTDQYIDVSEENINIDLRLYEDDEVETVQGLDNVFSTLCRLFEAGAYKERI